MAKEASMYRPTNKVGLWDSRYCAESKKGKCKRYDYYHLNSCDPQDWAKIQAARRVIIPITKL